MLLPLPPLHEKKVFICRRIRIPLTRETTIILGRCKVPRKGVEMMKYTAVGTYVGAVKMNKKKRDMGNRLGRLNGESRILFIYS